MGILENSKHEIFARSIAVGNTLHDAAVDAGYKPSGANRQGVRLSHNVIIASRVAELKELAADDTVMTINQRMVKLTELATEKFRQPVMAREAVQAVAELNKMTVGAYPPAQVEVETGKELTEFLKGLRGYSANQSGTK